MAECEVPKFFSIDETAEMLGVHRNTVKKMIADGRLTAARSSNSTRGRVLIPLDSIRALAGSTGDTVTPIEDA
jgi:excisionase family DNA binding protein